MNTVFGEIIRKVWRNSGITQRDFASSLSMSLRNAQNLFERDDFSITQLIEISKVLKTDFVSEFLDYKKYPLQKDKIRLSTNENDTSYKAIKPLNEITIQLNIRGDVDSITKHFSTLLNKIRKEAEELNLKIT